MRPRWFLGVLVIHVMLGRLPAAEIASHDVYLDLGQAPDAPLALWYGRPATRWLEALPLGNGRVGAMVYQLLTECIEASKTLGIDEDFRARLEKARTKLPPVRIGGYGQLQEWLEDYPEAIPNHRHTSHLAALYPSSQITPRGTPELAKAARVTINRRLGQANWVDVEWSRANMINYFARLGDGDQAYRCVLGLIGKLSDKNLLTFSAAGIAGRRTTSSASMGTRPARRASPRCSCRAMRARWNCFLPSRSTTGSRYLPWVAQRECRSKPISPCSGIGGLTASSASTISSRTPRRRTQAASRTGSSAP